MEGLLKDIVKTEEADYLEVRVEDTSYTKIHFQGEVLENIDRSRQFGGNIRALVNGGWGFVTFNSVEKLPLMVKKAIKNASIAGQEADEKVVLAQASSIEKRVIHSIINNPKDIPLSKKVALLDRYNSILLSSRKEIKSTSVRYFDKETKLCFANSEGTYIYQEKLDIGCNLSAVAVKGNNTQYGFVGRGSSNDYCVVSDLDDECRLAYERAAVSLSADKVKGGEYTVILDPLLAGTFIHEAFGHLSEGDNTYEDKRLQDIMRMGREFGRPILNVYDTGLDIGRRGYVAYDDEGVPAQKTYLINKGKLTGRLHSRETAGKMKEQATGNARAISYRFPPICRMRNTCIENGEASFEDMLKGIKKGIYARGTVGGQTNGEMFTFTAEEAFMIEDGKVGKRVRDVTLSGNVFSTLANIDMIGNDFEIHDSAGGCGKGGQVPLPISHGSPHIRIKSVIVGGAGR